MKKHIKYLLIVLFAVIGLSIGFTRGEYEQEFSPIFPICGEWNVSITNTQTDISVATVIYTYDTADKSGDQVWLWINNSTYGTKCKLSCVPNAGTFSGADAQNTLLSGTNTVSEGKVVINGADTPSGHKADSIEFTYYSSLTKITYKVKGFRRTGWPEDE